LEKIEDVDKFLSINQKLLLEVKIGDNAGTYDSRVEDIEKEVLHVSMPAERGVTVPLRPKTKLHISFVMDRGRLSFKSIVEDRYMDPRPMLKIAKPEVLFREELRSFFRVETRVNVKILVDINEGDIIKQKMFPAKLLDLSGGGGKVFCDAPIEKGDVFELFFMGAIDRLESVKMEARRVVRVDDHLEVGSEFYSVSQGERDKIIKYVFKRQVELRKLLG